MFGKAADENFYEGGRSASLQTNTLRSTKNKNSGANIGKSDESVRMYSETRRYNSELTSTPNFKSRSVDKIKNSQRFSNVKGPNLNVYLEQPGWIAGDKNSFILESARSNIVRQ